MASSPATAQAQAGAPAAPVTASTAGGPTAPEPVCPVSRDDHNALVRRGAELVEPFLVLADRQPASLDAARVRAGIACFDRALVLIPVDWQLMWMRGKAYQALGEHSAAMASLRDAWQLQPGEPAIANELGYELVELERAHEAVEVFAAAAAAHPDDDAALQANFALALLLDGQLARAKETVARALAANPQLRIARELAALVDDVAAGRRPPPRTLRDLD